MQVRAVPAAERHAGCGKMTYTVYDSIGIWLAETRDVTRAQGMADQEGGFVRDESGTVLYEATEFPEEVLELGGFFL